jgi:3',5'-cyclic AMP phosphodiesterase CpdA
MLGDTGAWPDPTADAIFAQLLRQAAQREPAFIVNLGDLAGPGTPDRHAHYLELVRDLEIPNVCLIGNHDLEDPAGAAAWARAHGRRNFTFAHGDTRFVAIDGASGEHGEIEDTTRIDMAGPGRAALAYLDAELADAREPHRVVLTHAPPNLDGHYAPQQECGFRQNEREFLALLQRHGVQLVCCAHGLGYDHHVHHGVRYVMSGGGGAAVFLSYRETAHADRAGIYHAVELTLDGAAVSGQVFQAFAPTAGPPVRSF